MKLPLYQIILLQTNALLICALFTTAFVFCYRERTCIPNARTRRLMNVTLGTFVALSLFHAIVTLGWITTALSRACP